MAVDEGHGSGVMKGLRWLAESSMLKSLCWESAVPVRKRCIGLSAVDIVSNCLEYVVEGSIPVSGQCASVSIPSMSWRKRIHLHS